MNFIPAYNQFNARLPELVLTACVLTAMRNPSTRSARRIIAFPRWCERERHITTLRASSRSCSKINVKNDMRLIAPLILFHVAPFNMMGGEFQ